MVKMPLSNSRIVIVIFTKITQFATSDLSKSNFRKIHKNSSTTLRVIPLRGKTTSLTELITMMRNCGLRDDE